MSLFWGLTLGVGLLLIWQSFSAPPAAHRGASPLRRRLDAAGLRSLPTATAVGCALAVVVAIGVVAFSITHALPVAIAMALAGLVLPWWWLRARHRTRLKERAAAWPDVVDQLRSAVRAGLPLSEALAHLATSGPEPLRWAFAAYASDLRVSRSADEALERLGERLLDPVADRIIAAVGLARQVGGADVGTMLATLSGFLRAELNTRGELEARQSWTINGARLAVAAPWIILVLLCLEPRVARAYTSGAGILVLTVGAVVAVLSYRLMLSLARLEDDASILSVSNERPGVRTQPATSPVGGGAS